MELEAGLLEGREVVFACVDANILSRLFALAPNIL